MGGTLYSQGTRIAVFAALGMAVYAWIVRSFLPEVAELDRPVAETALALGTGLLLAVRINRAYERWWEARTLWGRLVNVSRNLAAKAHAYARPEGAEARRFADLITGFAYALRDHLRAGVRLQDVEGFRDEGAAPAHVPLWLATRIFEQLRTWDTEGRTTPEQLWPLDQEVRGLMDVCGACERIRNTLMPASLAMLTRVLMLLVAAALPWVLHDDGTVLYVVVVVFFATFLLLVVETTASVIERPFGRDVNQLRLTPLCETIRRTVDQALDVDGAVTSTPSTHTPERA